MSQEINRRKFLRQTGAAALSFAFLPSFARTVAPSDKLRIAHIGVNGMGNNHMKWFAGIPEVDIVALCDVDQTHLDTTMKTLQTLRPGSKVDAYADFRQVLDRKDIDAITCATPDHWHAQIATLAFQAGKDVYGEKPLSYDIREGQMMLKNMKRYDRIFQLGNQIHAGDNFHRVVEIIRSGKCIPCVYGKQACRLISVLQKFKRRLLRSIGTCGWDPLLIPSTHRNVVILLTGTF